MLLLALFDVEAAFAEEGIEAILEAVYAFLAFLSGGAAAEALASIPGFADTVGADRFRLSGTGEVAVAEVEEKIATSRMRMSRYIDNPLQRYTLRFRSELAGMDRGKRPSGVGGESKREEARWRSETEVQVTTTRPGESGRAVRGTPDSAHENQIST